MGSQSEDETFGGRLKKIRRERGFTQTQLARESDLTVPSISELETGSNPARLTETPVLRCIKGLLKLHAITTRDEVDDLLFIFFTERREKFLHLEQLGPKGRELLTILKEGKGERSDFGKGLHEKYLDPHNITQQQLADKSGVATNIISEMVTGEWFAQSQTLSDDLYAIFIALAELCGTISITPANNLLKTIPASNLNKERRIHLLTRLIREDFINPTYLTLHQTPFIGRDEDIKEIYFRLQKMQSEGIRFLTLVGLPGVGKTEVARQIKLLVQTLENFVEVFQISFEVETNVADILQEIDEYQRGKDQQNQTLIILDNCELIEHIDEARIRLYRYLEEHSQLTILATGRISFSDEEYEVKPLEMPSNTSESVEKLRNCGAIKLFLEYANSNTPVLELTEKTKEAITAICIKLDALPLALLLAASLVGALGLDELYNIIHESEVQTLENSLADDDHHRTLKNDLNKALDDLLIEANKIKEVERFSKYSFYAIEYRIRKIRHDVNLSKYTWETLKDIKTNEPSQRILKTLQKDDIQSLEYPLADNDRHRTLEKLLKASYNLLQEQEKGLFWRLGIFFAPCSLKAVAIVCDLGDIPHILNLLSTLRRHHLITFQNEQVAISHNIIRSFARKQIEDDFWMLLMNSFDDYYSKVLHKYQTLKEEQSLQEEKNQYFIDDFNNIKAANWMKSTLNEYVEDQEYINAIEVDLIFKHPFHHPIKYIILWAKFLNFLLLLFWNSLKGVFIRVKFKQ